MTLEEQLQELKEDLTLLQQEFDQLKDFIVKKQEYDKQVGLAANKIAAEIFPIATKKS